MKMEAKAQKKSSEKTVRARRNEAMGRSSVSRELSFTSDLPLPAEVLSRQSLKGPCPSRGVRRASKWVQMSLTKGPEGECQVVILRH